MVFRCMECGSVGNPLVHASTCPQHPDARIIRLEKRVAELEKIVDPRQRARSGRVPL